MLKLNVIVSESFDEETHEFLTEEISIELEHSLVSLSKWESRFEKPFLSKDEKSNEELIEYIRLMILTPDVPENIIDLLSDENVEQIQTYINAKMTATWFREEPKGGPAREQITSELFYYWITSYQIPWEVQNWHLERLLTLIKVFNAKNEKPKKRSQSELAAERRALNERRREEYKTSG